MSDRRVRAAEWLAFANLLDVRAKNIKRSADAAGNHDLVSVAIALLGVSADATAIALVIRDGDDDEPEGPDS